MTRIRLLSDLHNEFGMYEDTLVDKDTILVLAGDIHLGVEAEEFVRSMCDKYKYVVYVHGNHEYYGHNIQTVIQAWHEIENTIPNLHFLHNDSRILDGVKFIGGTMWTGFNDFDIKVMNEMKYTMNDFAKIRYQGRILSPQDVVFMHKEFCAFLEHELTVKTTIKTVVVTHHSPGNSNVLKKLYHDNLGRYAYYANMEKYTDVHAIDLWLHGHTHINADYYMNKTRIVSNPRGYVNYKLNDDFISNCLIEI